MTEQQKNETVAIRLHELQMGLTFVFASILLLVVLVAWVVDARLPSFSVWFNHAESIVFALTIFLVAAAFQPSDSWIQKRFTRFMQTFWSKC